MQSLSPRFLAILVTLCACIPCHYVCLHSLSLCALAILVTMCACIPCYYVCVHSLSLFLLAFLVTMFACIPGHYFCLHSLSLFLLAFLVTILLAFLVTIFACTPCHEFFFMSMPLKKVWLFSVFTGQCWCSHLDIMFVFHACLFWRIYLTHYLNSDSYPSVQYKLLVTTNCSFILVTDYLDAQNTLLGVWHNYDVYWFFSHILIALMTGTANQVLLALD